IVGDRLPQLIDELEAVHGNAAAAASIDDVLAGSRDLLLEHGLSALGDEQRRRLLTQPALLADLQELVLLEGGAYWNTAVREAAKASAPLARSTAPGRVRPWRTTLRWAALAASLLVCVSLGWAARWFTQPDSARPLTDTGAVPSAAWVAALDRDDLPPARLP